MNSTETLHRLLIGAFENQDALNKRLDPDWATKGFPYYRAVWTECGEAVGHGNWMWWKTKQYREVLSEQQIADIHIELCDILHFGLSMAIVEATNLPARSTAAPGTEVDVEVRYDHYIEHAARMYQQFFKETRQTPTDFYEDIECVAMLAIKNQEFSVEHFARACDAASLSLTRLLVLYYSKSTLNAFRWDNGYNIPKGQPGAYQKMWAKEPISNISPESANTVQTVEDNWHLNRIVGRMLSHNTDEELLAAMGDGSFQAGLKGRLQIAYNNYAPSFPG